MFLTVKETAIRHGLTEPEVLALLAKYTNIHVELVMGHHGLSTKQIEAVSFNRALAKDKKDKKHIYEAKKSLQDKQEQEKVLQQRLEKRAKQSKKKKPIKLPPPPKQPKKVDGHVTIPELHEELGVAVTSIRTFLERNHIKPIGKRKHRYLYLRQDIENVKHLFDKLPKNMINLTEAEEETGIPRATLNSWITNKKINGKIWRGRWHVDKEELKKWIADNGKV